ncbi:MAG: hypothetical protein IJP10_05110 [Clostridia bacterium]|nr:hypothetical protein [Clostridia bacterium]
MRDIMGLNFGWRFSPDFKQEYIHPDFKDTAFKLVDIPHTVSEAPGDYSVDRNSCGVSCYRKMFVMPSGFEGKRLFLYFDGVANCAAAFFNGKPVCAHKGSFTPFSCEVTGLAKRGDNLITVIVDSTERDDTPPFGGQIDIPCGGGIYREVRLEAVDETSIREFTAVPVYSDGDWSIDIKGSLTSDKGAGFTFYLFDSQERKISAKYYNCSGESFECLWDLPCEVKEWSCKSPVLYTLKIVLDSGDEVSARLGFRRAQFRSDGFYLGDEKIRLVGLSRHQNFPTIKNALPRSAQRLDVELLSELGCNIVSTSHCPPSKHFLDRCDELGILVIEDLPAYGHIGDSDWKDTLCDNLSEMIVRDISHPSVVLWNIRIEDAPDDSELDNRLAAIARKLDPTRQLGGLHDSRGSTVAEDVFLYKDYSHNGDNPGLERKKNVVKSKNIPYVIAAHSGQNAPARSIDRESYLLRQALHHAKVLDAYYGDPEICAAIGCCLSDFSAGKCIGFANHLCACGVTDSSRIKKLAAYVYISQKEDEPVLRISSDLSPDEQGEVWAFTNCDEVKLHIGGELIGSCHPNRKLFPNLPHPPILIENSERLFSGNEKIVFEGIKNGSSAASVTVEPVRRASLKVTASSSNLHHSDTYDVARIELEAVDQNGNRLHYCSDAVNIECDGSMEVIGSKLFSLEGGAAAFYVRTKGGKGQAVAKITTESFGEHRVVFDVTRTLPPKDSGKKDEPPKETSAKTTAKSSSVENDAPPPVVVHDFDDSDSSSPPPASEVKDAVHTFNQKRNKKNKHKK